MWPLLALSGSPWPLLGSYERHSRSEPTPANNNDRIEQRGAARTLLQTCYGRSKAFKLLPVTTKLLSPLVVLLDAVSHRLKVESV